MLNYFPKYFTNKAIILYLMTLLTVSLLFFQYTMQWFVYMIGIVEVVAFFYFSNLLTKRWALINPKSFGKKIFTTSLILRVVWVIFSYFFYNAITGTPFEYSAADSLLYHNTASQLANNGFSAHSNILWGLAFSDKGYITYLGGIYSIFGNGVIIPRLLKAILGAWTALLVYKVASRSFGESAGRIAAVLVMLMPNLIFYCGLHLKEVEMVFMSVLFVERADFLLRSGKYNFINVATPLLLAILMFAFRTVLGATALFALITTLLWSSSKVFGLGQRFIVGLWVCITILYFLGGRISNEIEEIWENRKTNQRESMEWRAQREGGNTYADKASAAIFAPAIFIIPIPTLVNIETQLNQQLLNGGNFDKGIFFFFIIVVAIWIIKEKKWRDFTLPGTFMLGYLAIIAMSSFAQSERFHQPALPFIMMFAALGITKVSNKTKPYYLCYLLALFLIIIVWNWIKLSGRGLV